MGYWKEHFQRTFVIDERSLILARVFTFIAILWSFSNYYGNLFFLSPESGFFPPEYFPGPYEFFPFNLFRLGNSLPVFYAAFFTGVIASFFFLCGKWTKPAIVIIWLINLSLRNQANLESRAFETLIQIALVWFLFFPQPPLQRLWKKTETPKLLSGLVVFGWYNQIAMLYFFSFLHKLQNPKWASLDALKLIFSKYIYQTPLSPSLLSSPALLKAMTLISLAIELFAPVFLYFCFRNYKWRSAVIASFLIFHLSILLFLQVGIFTPMSLALWVSLILWRPILSDEKTLIQSGQIKNALALMLIVFTLLINIDGLINQKRDLLRALSGTGLTQRWSMFATRNHTAPINLWLGSKATFKDQSGEWDVINNQAVDFSKAPKLQSVDYIWWAFVSQIAFTSKERADRITRLFPSYYCERWNGAHEKKIAYIEIKIIRNVIPPFQLPRLYPQESDLISGPCP